jgi:hypothetical protein
MRTTTRIFCALCALAAMRCIAAPACDVSAARVVSASPAVNVSPSKLDYLVLASMAESPYLLAMAAYRPMPQPALALDAGARRENNFHPAISEP